MRLATFTQYVTLFVCLPISLAQAGDLNFSYGLGVRNDALRWTIAADIYGSSPNIMSELTWRDLKGWNHEFGLEYLDASGWMGRAKLGWAGFDLDGEVQDSDYNFDNRTGEYSRSLNTAQGSTAQSTSIIIGHRFHIDVDSLAITPIVGLSQDIIDLRMNNAVQMIPASGPYPDLNNRYRAQFTSTVVGLEACWWFASPFGIDLKWHHLWNDYHAEADWNLRTDLQHPVSFYQDGKGTENRWNIGFLARVNKDWIMEIAYSRHSGKLQNGIDVANNSNGTQQLTRLNEVEWSSVSTSLVAKRFF